MLGSMVTDRPLTALDNEVVDLRNFSRHLRTKRTLKIVASMYKIMTSSSSTFGRFQGHDELAQLMLHGPESFVNMLSGKVQNGKSPFQIMMAIISGMLSLYPFIFVLNTGGSSFIESFERSIREMQEALFERVQEECSDFLDQDDVTWRDMFRVTVADTLKYGRCKGQIIKPGREQGIVVFIGNNNKERIDNLFQILHKV